MLFSRPWLLLLLPLLTLFASVLCLKCLHHLKSLHVLPYHSPPTFPSSSPSSILLFLLPPSFSFRLHPSLSDESINFSRSICGTQWLRGASLLLKHKLISRSNPQSINHRPSTCSPLHLCLLLFPLTSYSVSPLHVLSADMHLRAHTCPHTHTFETSLRCVTAEWAGTLWVLEGRES